MPLDRETARKILRKAAIQIDLDSGHSSWEECVVEEKIVKGKVVISVIPDSTAPAAARNDDTPLPGSIKRKPADDDTARGRPGEIGPAIMDFVRTHPNCNYSDIVAAMLEQHGYSQRGVDTNLKVLKQLRYLVQDRKGGPYRARIP